jgi:hypothetical protein
MENVRTEFLFILRMYYFEMCRYKLTYIYILIIINLISRKNKYFLY